MVCGSQSQNGGKPMIWLSNVWMISAGMPSWNRWTDFPQKSLLKQSIGNMGEKWQATEWHWSHAARTNAVWTGWKTPLRKGWKTRILELLKRACKGICGIYEQDMKWQSDVSSISGYGFSEKNEFDKVKRCPSPGNGILRYQSIGGWLDRPFCPCVTWKVHLSRLANLRSLEESLEHAVTSAYSFHFSYLPYRKNPTFTGYIASLPTGSKPSFRLLRNSQPKYWTFSSLFPFGAYIYAFFPENRKHQMSN